jgi:hypothetical protein
MEPVTQPATPSAPAAPAPAATATSTTETPTTPPSGYGPAVGRSLADKEKVRQLEQIAADKTASDYVHIVWAYGVLWALFAAYGLFLWRRSARLRADMNDLRATLDRRTP